MKKFLVLSLVLVMALAGTVFAEGIQFSGEFGAKVEQNVITWDEDESAFEFLQGNAKYSHNIKLNMKSTSDTFNLTVNLANESDAGAAFTKLDANAGYTLKVNDDLGNLTVWQGDTNSQGFVQDPFGLIQGRDKGAATVRAKASIMDLANVTLQLEPNRAMVAHVDADVYGAQVGVIARRQFNDVELSGVAVETTVGYEIDQKTGNIVEIKENVAEKYATINNALDSVVLHASYDFDIVEVTVAGGLSMNNTKEPAGYDKLDNTILDGDGKTGQKDKVDGYLADLENAFAYGAKVVAPITDQITAEASYVFKPQDWKGNGNNSAVATVKGSYKADALAVNANFKTEGKHVNDPEKADDRTTTIGLDGSYDVTDEINVKLAAEYKIEKDKPGLEADTLDNINTTKLTANVSAPIVADLVSVKANVGYTFDNYGAILVGTPLENASGFGKTGKALRQQSSLAFAKSLFEAGATVTVTPIEKLTVAPSVTFKSYKDGLKEVATENLAAVRKLRGGTNTGDYKTDNYTAGSIITLKADATYAVGGGATITLSAGNNSYNFTEVDGNDVTLKYNNPFASAAVKVVF